nr:hypothetical protein CFP56_10450 [Quercus suber]
MFSRCAANQSAGPELQCTPALLMPHSRAVLIGRDIDMHLQGYTSRLRQLLTATSRVRPSFKQSFDRGDARVRTSHRCRRRLAATKPSVSPQPSTHSTRRGTLINQERLQSVSPGSSTSWSQPHTEGINVGEAKELGASMNADEKHCLPKSTSAQMPSVPSNGRYSSIMYAQAVDELVSQPSLQTAMASMESTQWSTREVPTWYNDMDDHFQSPGLVNVMFNFCQSCGLATTTTPLCQACTDALPIRPPMATSSDLVGYLW